MIPATGRRLTTFALPVLLLGLATPALAQGVRPRPPKLDRLLSTRAQQFTGRSRVIVEFYGTPDVRVITAAHGVAGRAMQTQRAHVAEIDNVQLLALARDPRVARVMTDRPAFATLERTAGAIGLESLAERDLTGTGVGVAVIDSGVNALHDDLWRSPFGRRVKRFKDFTVPTVTGFWATQVARDGFGHGTHVAGIIAGNGYDSSGRRAGIAPAANLVALKVLDDSGHGFVSDVIDALDYVTVNKTALGVRVINLSVGSGVYESYDTDPLAQAAKRAVDSGLVVVASAGNLGQNAAHQAQYGGITSPGNAPWVLTVGASSHQGTTQRGDDLVGAFSSHGPTWIDFSAKPDLVAPGVGIESLSDPGGVLYADLSGFLLDGTRLLRFKPYLSLTGTSMAAPVVAATVALMLEANPALTPNAVKAILQYTAQVLPRDPVLVQGAGLLNARGAVRLSRFFAHPQDGLGSPQDVIAGQPVAWARHLVWGNYRVTGGVPLPGSSAWAAGLEWGALKTPAGQDVVWGAASEDNVVWSESGDDNVVWSEAGGENVVWGTAGSDNVVWSEAGDDNVVWSEAGDDNVVWSEAFAENVVWGEDCGGHNCNNVVWGAANDGGAWGTGSPDDNVVWSEAADDNVVWSEGSDDNVVWSEAGDDNVVWSETARGNQVLWPPPVDDRRARPGTY